MSDLINPVEFEQAGKELMQDVKKDEKDFRLPDKYKLCGNEQELLASIEKTHPQLTPLIEFEMCVILGRKAGLLHIAPKASGKTTSCRAVSKYFRCSELDKVSKNLNKISGKKVSLVFHDLANTLTKDEEGSLEIISPLIYDESIEAGKYHIKNVDLAVIAAGPPNILRMLMREELWDNQMSDRFLRLYWMYWDKSEVITTSLPEIPKLDFTTKIKGMDVDKELFESCVSLLEYQLTHERAYLVTNSLLRGHAMLCGRDVIRDVDCSYILTYTPFIRVENYFNLRQIEDKRLGWGGITPVTSFIEVLYAVTKKKEITMGELKKSIKGVSSIHLRNVLKQLEPAGIRWDDKSVTIEGRLRAELEQVYTTFH